MGLRVATEECGKFERKPWQNSEKVTTATSNARANSALISNAITVADITFYCITSASRNASVNDLVRAKIRTEI